MKGKEEVNPIALPLLGKIKVKSSDETMEDTSPSKKKYIRKFQSKWLRDSRFSSWLVPCEENETDAFCTLCNRKISGSVTLLERHSRTKKHIKKFVTHNPISAHNIFPQFFTKKEKKSKSEDEEDGIKGNFGEDDYEIDRTANLPGEDHNAYIISSSMNPSFSDKKNGKFFKDTLEAANFIQQTVTKHREEDEFDHFGRSIASQLRKLPEESAVSLISELQCMVTQKRLKVIAERESQTPSITSQVLTVELDENQTFTT